MQLIERAATASTPFIRMDPSNGWIELRGESYPANSYEFYGPVLDWMKEYIESGNPVSVFFAIAYANTSSVKVIFDMLDLLEEAFNRGQNVHVAWSYDFRNTRLAEVIAEFQDEVSFQFTVHNVPGS